MRIWEYIKAGLGVFIVFTLFFGFYEGTLNAKYWDVGTCFCHGFLVIHTWIFLVCQYFNINEPTENPK